MERIRLASDCTIYPIDKNTDLSSFCCGDEDLDEFFRNDAYLYSAQLLGDTSQPLNTRMMYLDLIDFVSYSRCS